MIITAVFSSHKLWPLLEIYIYSFIVCNGSVLSGLVSFFYSSVFVHYLEENHCDRVYTVCVYTVCVRERPISSYSHLTFVSQSAT